MFPKNQPQQFYHCSVVVWPADLEEPAIFRFRELESKDAVLHLQASLADDVHSNENLARAICRYWQNVNI